MEEWYNCVHTWFISMSHCTWWPPSSLRPASFLVLRGWVWCRLTWRGRSPWRARPACQPPGRSLNQGTEQGDKHHAAPRRKIPEGAVTLHNDPLSRNPPSINNTPLTSKPCIQGAEDIILHWQIIQHLHHNDMKISFIGHARHSTCCVVHGVHINM